VPTYRLADRVHEQAQHSDIHEAVTDDEVIGEALAGTQRAYAALVDRYQRPVYRLIARLVGDPSVAAELAQDTFLKTFRRLESFDRSRDFSPWILRIAHNTAVDALRRGRLEEVEVTHEHAHHGVTLASSSPGPHRHTENRLMLPDLQAGLRRLRPDHRTALLLRVEGERSYTDIAYVMGVAVGTAKSYVHRARRELADDLRGAGWGGATDVPGPRST
jgi:RNA polymerase sigma-70 factor, ECF subfamily